MDPNAGVSLKPSDQQRGGLIDDVDGEAISHKFVMWDYNGGIPVPVPALQVLIRPVGESDDKIATQYYSAGDPEKFKPSDDGMRLISLKGNTGMNDNCNASLYISSICAAGFPEDKLENEVSCFDGLIAHFKREAQPKRGGIIKTQAEGEAKKKDSDYLKVSKIITLPWDNKNKGKTVVAGAPKVAAAGAPKPAGAVASAAPAAGGALTISDEGRELAQTMIVEMLQEEEFAAGIPKAKLGVQAIKRLKGNPLQKEVTGFIGKPEFLGEEGAPWSFDAASGLVTAG